MINLRFMISRTLFSGLCALLICMLPSVSFGQETVKFFGEKIKPTNAISYDQMLEKMKDKDRLETKVKGKVLSVCQVKGCWMNIVSNDPKKEPMFVKFKDYGFFMPKDIAGKEVIMEGEAFYETTTVDELKHYAEDEGLSKDKIDAIKEPKKELKFLAKGVIVLN